MDKRKKTKSNPSAEYIEIICKLYGDSYDDREEDSKPNGEDWVPGEKALHTSLGAFKKELEEKYNILISTAKIRKILITGGLWTTERSREVAVLYEKYGSVRRVAEELGVTDELVTMYLPYEKVVYDLENKSGNAKRVERWRTAHSNPLTPGSHAELVDSEPIDSSDRTNTQDTMKTDEKSDALQELRRASDGTIDNWKFLLWKCICLFEGVEFTTSGRGKNHTGAATFTYAVTRMSSASHDDRIQGSDVGTDDKQRSEKNGSKNGRTGRHYEGPTIPGYGNELFITIYGVEKRKSISRSTVELGFEKAMELMKTKGYVKGPRMLGLPGARSYVFSILLKFGVITSSTSA